MTESSDCQPSSTSYPSPMVIDGSECDEVLANSKWLTRREVLERRSRRVKQLTKLYRNHYWALMEELKSKYKSYYWTYGKSPFKEDENRVSNSVDGTTENVKLGLGLGKGDEIKRCQLSGCKTKAMALTKFCHAHILSDPKQKLYKSCTYVIKSMQSGPLLCGKPVLRSVVPSLCPQHFQKGEKSLIRDLKKAGLNISSLNKIAPKLHVLVAEYIGQIQTKRRAAKKTIIFKVEK